MPTVKAQDELFIPQASPRLQHLVRELEAWHHKVTMLEGQLAKAKEMRQDLAENVIPEAMAAEDCEETGFVVPWYDRVVTLATSWHAGITKANREAAFAWLVANKEDDAIKQQVSVQFPLKARYEALAFQELVREAAPHAKVEVKETVPGSTLVALAKRLMEAGADWPADLFGAFKKRQVVLPWLKPEKPADED